MTTRFTEVTINQAEVFSSGYQGSREQSFVLRVLQGVQPLQCVGTQIRKLTASAEVSILFPNITINVNWLEAYCTVIQIGGRGSNHQSSFCLIHQHNSTEVSFYDLYGQRCQ